MAKTAGPPIVTILDDVEKCEKDVIESLLAIPDGRSVRVIINSGGGSVYASLAIATVIKMKQLRAEAVVLADCSSSALLIFAACETRRVAPHASFLFHPMKWSSEDAARLAGAVAWSSEFSRVNQISENWMIENLPINRRTLRKWVRDERYVEAIEIIELGLADELEFPMDKIIDISPKTRRRKPAAGAVRGKPARIRRVG